MSTCQNCGCEIPGLECGQCQGKNPLDAAFCCYCGQKLNQENPVVQPIEIGGDPFDVDNRILCSDESCIGVINEQGVCSECGRPYQAQGD
ncbi:MAG: hypothetical protein V1816_18480 [Pseudomonadota bacterium]